MTTDLSITPAQSIEDAVLRVLVVSVCLLAFLIMAIRVITRVPFFDEAVNMRYLWMMANGMHPHRDFCCEYPVLAHIVTLPFFKLLPESAYNVLVLRLFSTLPLLSVAVLLAYHSRRTAGSAVWGLLAYALIATAGPSGRFFAEYSIDHFAQLFAVAAMVLFFHPPTPTRVGWAAGLCVLSVAMTPKYGIPLALGGVAYGCAGISWRTRQWRSLWTGCAGIAGAFALVWCIYGIAGVSFADSLYWMYIQCRYQGTVVARGLMWMALARYFWIWAANTVLLGVGIAAWFLTQRKASWSVRVAPLGLLVGILVSAVSLRQLLEQYYVPVLVTCSLFVPFAGLLGVAAYSRRRVEIALSAAALLIMLLRLPGVAAELKTTPFNTRDENNPFLAYAPGPPGVELLAHTRALLRIIPPSEGVVGMWLHHPLFRKDASYATTDDRPSLVSLVPPDHPERRRMTPEAFKADLERSPPAFICLQQLDRNYPPGLYEVCRDFLDAHRKMYTETMFLNAPEYIRTDLVRPYELGWTR